ncbi:heme-dependent oxidative N-demethylase subunit alpha family protein [Hyphomonas sp.]|uniref:heme-dependent oxidative N-demethylase subunit alpha family protein n=1 Tax=Hyphomonas sp. TaxID=87 RepID=UPI001BCE8D8C|nr:heme-dependent oxidative N-demethylase subunit alpha family protein [Hyphomonas sp.]
MRRPPYLPFLNGPLSLAPGLRPIAPESWLCPDTEAHVLQEKRALMAARRGEVYGARDGSELAALELAAAVHGLAGPAAGVWKSALEGAASAVSDDICILIKDREGLWRLEAACLCAPTFWRLDEKLGEPLGGLHGPVPGANPGMVGRIHRMFDALRPGQVLERFNWTVQPGTERFTPSQAGFTAVAAGMDEAGALDALWLRVERQTISKLEISGAVVFTIRVAIDPLRAALEGAERCEAFAAAWDGIDPVLADYKGWPHYQRLVRAALAQAGSAR